jgi:DNA processing protein
VQSSLPLREILTSAVTVTGARAASGYGEHVAADLGFTLAEAGVSIVAGLGYGIDAAAHRGALTARGSTAAVLATGIDQCYPAGHARLLEEIRKDGVIITEYPPGTLPSCSRFLVRKRLLAALSQGTVIVEAGPRSGSLHTAHIARTLGRQAMAMPGPVISPQSAGCHRLLRERGIHLVTSASDVQQVLDDDSPCEPCLTHTPTIELSRGECSGPRLGPDRSGPQQQKGRRASKAAWGVVAGPRPRCLRGVLPLDAVPVHAHPGRGSACL